jgi:hypothetical protein
MSDREADQAAMFMTRLVVQLAIWMLFGAVILIWKYPKVMLPLLGVAGVIAIASSAGSW